MRFSIWPVYLRPWDELVAVARHCEAAGWHGLWYADHYMPDSPTPKPFSIRMSARTLERLEERALRRSEPKTRMAERLIDEGLRMEDHPGIAFRDGPTGRRAALAGGPDVCEIVETLQGTGLTGEEAVAATAEWGPPHTRQGA